MAFTKASGLWIDPLTEFNGRLMKSTPATVGATVRMLTTQVVNKVNGVYSFNPPLCRADMFVEQYAADSEDDSDVHALDDDGLVVLIKPNRQATNRVRERFRTLQQTEKKTSQLIEFIRDSDEDTDTVGGGGIDDLVDLFKGLRKDMGDLKAETVRLKEETVQLKRSLHQEQKERKEETARLKEETVRLNSLLRQEQEKLEQAIEDERRKSEQEMEEMRKTMNAENTKLAAESRRLEIELEAVKETANDTAEWIAIGCPDDSEVLRRIKLRNLLDRVQARLAFYTGLTTLPYTRDASGLWRGKLEGLTTPLRLASAHALLQGALAVHSQSKSNVSSTLLKFMGSAKAMEMAVELKSKLRENGDQVAHYALTKSQFSAVVKEYCQKGGKDEDGLKAFVDFLFS